MMKPQRIEQARVKKTVQGLRVLDPRTNEAHTLNVSMALVWEHCDGRTEPAALSKLLQKAFDVEPAAADELLRVILKHLSDAELLRDPFVADDDPVMSRRQLVKVLAIAGYSAALVPFFSSAKVQAGVPGPTTAAEDIETLKATLLSLNLSLFAERPLEARLDTAASKLAAGWDDEAIWWLQSFIDLVNTFTYVFINVIDTDTGAALRDAALAIIAKIEVPPVTTTSEPEPTTTTTTTTREPTTTARPMASNAICN